MLRYVFGLGLGLALTSTLSCSANTPEQGVENLEPQPSSSEASSSARTDVPSQSNDETAMASTAVASDVGSHTSSTAGTTDSVVMPSTTTGGTSAGSNTSLTVDPVSSTDSSGTTTSVDCSTLGVTGFEGCDSDASSVPSDTPSQSTSSGLTSTGGETTEPPPVSGNAPCAVPDYIFDDPLPVGWASEGGGTTGGDAATPQLVTSLAELQAAVSGATPKVIYVQGELQVGKVSFGSNKTLIGCSSGAHIHGTVGIGSGSSNIIVRNVQTFGLRGWRLLARPGVR